MPLGVPKVPFLLPESEDSEDKDSNWVDLYNRLYRAGFLFLCNKIEPEVTNNLTNLLVYLGIEDPTRDLYLFINSTGGGIVPGMSIFDTMQEVRPDVYTVCIGKAYSMASFILAGGKLTKRLAFPHARVMMHQPICSFKDVTNLAGEALDLQEALNLRAKMTRTYGARTGQPLFVVSQDLERDFYMSAAEAQDYGIIDSIVRQEVTKEEKEDGRRREEEVEIEIRPEDVQESPDELE